MDDWIVCQSYVHCSNTRLLWVTIKESRKLTHPIICQFYVRGRKVKKHWPLFPTVVPPDGIAPQYRRLPDALCPLIVRNWDDRQTFHTWRSGTSLAPITTLGLVLNCMFSFELRFWRWQLKIFFDGPAPCPCGPFLSFYQVFHLFTFHTSSDPDLFSALEPPLAFLSTFLTIKHNAYFTHPDKGKKNKLKILSIYITFYLPSYDKFPWQFWPLK